MSRTQSKLANLLTTGRINTLTVFTALLLASFNISHLIHIDSLHIKFISGIMLLSFIPGALLISSLGLSRSNTEFVMMSFGTSIVLDSIVAFILTTFGPKVSNTPPISTTHIVISINMMVISLLILNFYKSHPSRISIPNFGSGSVPKLITITMLPILSVLGAYFTYTYRLNQISFLVFCLIPIVVFLFCIQETREDIYPIALWSITLSLFILVSLSSKFVTNWDTAFVYSLTNDVLKVGFWNPGPTSAPKVSLIPVVVLAPVVVKATGGSLTLVFKILYPLIYSTLPLVVYMIAKKQNMSSRTAFLIGFLFISFDATIFGITRLYRQALAMLFIALFLYSSFFLKKSHSQNLLSAIFATGIVISHYATSYLFAIIFAPVVLIILINQRFSLLSFFDDTIYESRIGTKFSFFAVLNITWYMFTSGFFNGFVSLSVYLFRDLGLNSIGSSSSGSSQTAQEVQDIPMELLPFVSRVSMYALVGIIGATIAFLFIRQYLLDKSNEDDSILVDDAMFLFAGSSVSLLVITLIIPYPFFTISRIYALLSVFLTQFLSVGIITISELIKRHANQSVSPIPIIMAFTLVFFSLNTGLPQEVVGDDHPNFAVQVPDQSDSLIQTADALDRNSWTTNRDIQAINWMKNHDSLATVYTDSLLDVPFTSYGGLKKATRNREIQDLISYPSSNNQGSSVTTYTGSDIVIESGTNQFCTYLGSANQVENVVKYREDWVVNADRAYLQSEPVEESFDRGLNKIYSGGTTGYWCNQSANR
ncbi:DUF2206 domain-containing protein [Haloferax volcanii]|uniref:DUF2206 domain-containing protein n=1 Tax=Haloferax volcanii TaxID=2246 RepID=A0A558G9I2_HALVO|nr:DUF2206 domain-containing protein [Haloferax volcanii]TVT94422.1 DUF2206 domain-containing protein [Haloferax volcanii]